MARDWQTGRADAVQRIELYEEHVGRALNSLRELGAALDDRELWIAVKRHFALEIANLPDSDFYRTFLNSITRDLFATVGVDEDIEFTATASGRASGSVPIRVHPVGDSLERAVGELLADLPFASLFGEVESFARQICRAAQHDLVHHAGAALRLGQRHRELDEPPIDERMPQLEAPLGGIPLEHVEKIPRPATPELPRDRPCRHRYAGRRIGNRAARSALPPDPPHRRSAAAQSVQRPAQAFAPRLRHERPHSVSQQSGRRPARIVAARILDVLDEGCDEPAAPDQIRVVIRRSREQHIAPLSGQDDARAALDRGAPRGPSDEL